MNRIPKIIHCCWFSNEPIPNQIRQNLQNWQRFNPDYQIYLWTSRNFNESKKLFTRRAARQKQSAAIASYVGWLKLLKTGGVYLNSRLQLKQSLNQLLHEQAFTGLDRTGRITSNVIFAARPMDHNVSEVVDFYNRLAKRNDLRRYLGDDVTIATAHFLKYGLQKSNERQLINHCQVYPINDLTNVLSSVEPKPIQPNFKQRVRFYLRRMVWIRRLDLIL